LTDNGIRLAPPSTLSCVLTLIFVRLGLAIRGYVPTRRALERLSNPIRTAAQRPVSVSLTITPAQISARVNAAAIFLPTRAVCLEQSLTLYFLLRRRGLDPQLQIGVHPFPFAAHAWVELEASPINEDPAITRTFRVLSASRE